MSSIDFDMLHGVPQPRTPIIAAEMHAAALAAFGRYYTGEEEVDSVTVYKDGRIEISAKMCTVVIRTQPLINVPQLDALQAHAARMAAAAADASHAKKAARNAVVVPPTPPKHEDESLKSGDLIEAFEGEPITPQPAPKRRLFPPRTRAAAAAAAAAAPAAPSKRRRKASY